MVELRDLLWSGLSRGLQSILVSLLYRIQTVGEKSVFLPRGGIALRYADNFGRSPLRHDMARRGRG